MENRTFMEDRTFVVTEFCANCENEVEIHGWDTERDGYQAFCPHCGEVLMLCDECQHSESYKNCDWDISTKKCHRYREKWYAEIKWCAADVIEAAAGQSISLTEEQAQRWLAEHEMDFRDLLIEDGNERLSNINFEKEAQQ